MIAFAWVNPSERERFNLFPEVITVDTVAGTNNENRPLLTMGGKDSNGKMFIFLRAYLPHERGWIFRWIFSIVLPKMFNKNTLSRSKLIISDGDLQEYSQIDNASKKYFPNLLRIRCGWHIVDRSWEKRFSSKASFPEAAQLHYDTMKKTIQNWLYSWMKPSCETMEEYLLSKYLLHRYLASAKVVKQVSTLMYEHFNIYVKGYIETHESKYLFCLRKHIRHYAEYSNTILEGCNNTIKYHSSSVTPASRLDNSFTIIANNSDLKHKGTNKYVHSQFHSKPPLRSREVEKQMCATHLTVMGYETLLSSFNHSKTYKSHKYDSTTWYVTQTEEGINVRKKFVIPAFKRVRTVILCNDMLKCDYPHGKIYGLPCWHEIHVASLVHSWKFPTHHDCSVTWWKSYYYYGMSSLSFACKERETIYKSFHTLKQNERLGINVDSSKYFCLPIDGNTLPADFICDSSNPMAHNYANMSYLDMTSETGQGEVIQGMTQLSSIVPNDNDELETFFEENDFLPTDSNTAQTDITAKPYNYLISSFKILTNIMESNCNREDVMEIETFLTSSIKKFTTQIRETDMPREFPVSTNFVSSNPPSSKKRKHHGCRGY